MSEATRAQVRTGLDSPDGAWYGYQFRMSQHGYRGDGAYGQYCLVLPDEDAVVAMTAQTRSAGRPDMQTVLTLVWDKLLPTFKSGSLSDTGGDGRLRARLERLSLPATRAEASPLMGEAWAEATFFPEEGSCEEQPSLRAVKVNSGNDGWSVALCEDGGELEAPISGGGWAVTEHAITGGNVMALASGGGWLTRAVLRIDVIFLETPDRLSVTCNLEDKTFRASWASRPGHASRLRDLLAPTS